MLPESHAPPGTSITVPNVSRPFDYHTYPSSYRPPSSATARAKHVSVGLNEKILSIHENGRLIATIPITSGFAEHPAPAGEWRIVGALPFPWFRYAPGVLKRGERTGDLHNFPTAPTTPLASMAAPSPNPLAAPEAMAASAFRTGMPPLLHAGKEKHRRHHPVNRLRLSCPHPQWGGIGKNVVMKHLTLNTSALRTGMPPLFTRW